MFIFDTKATSEKSPVIRSKKRTGVKTSTIPYETVNFTTEKSSLEALFLGLIQQKRWIYFLNQDVQLKAHNVPVLQVKLKSHHTQYECIQRIVRSGHASAIVIEKCMMDNEQLLDINHLCERYQIQLILLEKQINTDTLH